MRATGEARYRDLALESTAATLRLQHARGIWVLSASRAQHLIATVEGDWGAIGLLASYAREPRQEYLAGALRWYDYLVNRIGFQDAPPGKAINYFHRPRGKDAEQLGGGGVAFSAACGRRQGRSDFSSTCRAMLEFIAATQLPSGELPYIVAGQYESGREPLSLFSVQCFSVLEAGVGRGAASSRRQGAILARARKFLAKGVTPSGASAADCSSERPKWTTTRRCWPRR